MARNAKLNYFPLSHQHLTTMDMGKLVPVDFVECLPNDIFRIQNEFLLRFMPTIAPVMNRFRITLRWWYSPTRLLWDDWTDFITGGADGQNASTPPYVTAGENGFAVGSLADHFRIPTGVAGLKASALPFRMYDLVWNTWYRNEALQDEVTISKASGADVTTSLDMLRTGWRRDLYTDCLPATQKGPSVALPLGTTAPIINPSGSTIVANSTWKFKVDDGSTSDSLELKPLEAADHHSTGYVVGLSGLTGTDIDKTLKYAQGIKVNFDNLKADLSNATSATINQLRQAAAIQQFQELNMRGGNLYAEFCLNMYGCRTPDASLQRPQFVGGFSSNMVISEVLQTSESTQDSAQGTMAGHGIGAGASPLIKFRSLEHGYLMCLMSVVPDALYSQGIPVELTRETRYDYAIPLLANLGEAGLRNKCIYAQGPSVVDADNNVVDDKVFGYLPRYEEYRRIPSAVTGEMRSTLSYWTNARKFESLPQLTGEFVEAHPGTDIFAVEDDGEGGEIDHLVVQIMHHMDALRPISKRGTPGMHII